MLRPRGIHLHVVVAKALYRAHWRDDALFGNEQDRVFYGERREAAREGCRMLYRAGIGLAACADPDWDFLVGLCDADLARRYGDRAAPFTEGMVRARSEADAFYQQELDTMREEAAVGGGSGGGALVNGATVGGDLS